MFVNLSIMVACLLMAFGWLIVMYSEEASTTGTFIALTTTGVSMFLLGLLTGALYLLGVV